MSKGSHRIKIKHFLFLRDIDLDINDFTLMIGQQSSGKSSICKMIFFFKNLKNIFLKKIIELYELGDCLDEKEIKKEILSCFNREAKDLYVKLFGESYKLSDKTYVRYFYEKERFITLTVSPKEHYLSLQIEPNLINRIVGLSKNILKENNNDRPKGFFITNHYHQRIDDELKTIFNDHLESYYIPAGRNMFSLLRGQLATLQTDHFDYTNELFFFHLERFTSMLRDGLLGFAKQRGGKESEKIAQRIINFLGGEVCNNNGELTFSINNENQSLSLKFISSGQQEVMWIFYLLFIWTTCKDQVFVIIEEPEAHIHPTLQKEVMDFVAYFINQTKSQVILTTHSPYILTSANLLHYAGYLKNKEIKIDDIVLNGNHLDPNRSSFFEMQKQAERYTIEKICNPKKEDEVFVQVEKIDLISSEIEEIFSKLLKREVE